MKELKITIPDGFEIDKEHSTFELIKFKKIEKQLPKTWKELKSINGYFISSSNGCVKLASECDTSINTTKQLFPTKEYAEASLALAQLLQLRQVYNDGWEPDWSEESDKPTINSVKNIIKCKISISFNSVLSFKSKEIRDLFFENFRDLLEIAKPLL